MKENVPKIVITNRFFNTVKLFKQLEELEEFVDVNFNEEGLVPEYIEFDREDKSLYATIEELLTMYVNNKNVKEDKVDDNVREFNNVEIQSSVDDLKHVFPMLMFKKGTVKREDTVIDVDKMISYFMSCNKKIVFLINNYDYYYDLLLQSYINSLKFDYGQDKLKKLHIDAMVELEHTLLLIQEILTDSLFTYLDEMYHKLIDNVLYDDYKFDIALKFTMTKNSGELRIIDFIKEKRNLISEALIIAYYKANKLLKIKNDGDDI